MSPRCPRERLPRAAFSNSNTDNWIEHRFSWRFDTEQEINNYHLMGAAWVPNLTPNTVSRFQVESPLLLNTQLDAEQHVLISVLHNYIVLTDFWTLSLTFSQLIFTVWKALRAIITTSILHVRTWLLGGLLFTPAASRLILTTHISIIHDPSIH